SALSTQVLYRDLTMRMKISKIGPRLAKAAICLSMVGAASAQTVRPVINELHNPAKGWVEYVNESLTPLNVVLEPKSFTVSETIGGEIAGARCARRTNSFRKQSPAGCREHGRLLRTGHGNPAPIFQKEAGRAWLSGISAQPPNFGDSSRTKSRRGGRSYKCA